MKTLDAMRKDFVVYSKCTGTEIDVSKFVDKIQAELDRYYLPRPLFEDGEPVQIGEEIDFGGEVLAVRGFDIRVSVDPENPPIKYTYKRPPELDTQEKIDEDKGLFPVAYCGKYGLGTKYDDNERYRTLMIDHLLERQRKVCEAKS